MTGSAHRGPNVGFAYTLAERAKDRFRVGSHEHIGDVVNVVAEIAGKRATLFRRAPVIYDIEHAMALLGYDGSASPELVEARTLMVHDAGHDYGRRRGIVDAIPDEMLRASGAELKDRIDAWRSDLVARLVPELRELPTM